MDANLRAMPVIHASERGMNAVTLNMENTRRSERSGTFIKARLEQPGIPTRDVVVRNLSETGALIEGKDLPTRGLVELVRGDLRASATILRVDGRQRGLHFKHPILLPQWLPHFALRDIVEASQDKRTLDAGDAHDSRRKDTPPPGQEFPIYERVAEELALIERQMGQLLDTFADDTVVLMRHPKAMTRLEASQQLLGQLAKVLEASDPAAAANKVSMEEVRRRLLR